MFAIPPVPVVLATPVPVRLNQVSIVNCARSSFAGSPNVTYAPELPRSSAASPATGVTALESADWAPVPTALIAATRKV